jgi:hypothetical protein
MCSPKGFKQKLAGLCPAASCPWNLFSHPAFASGFVVYGDFVSAGRLPVPAAMANIDIIRHSAILTSVQF